MVLNDCSVAQFVLWERFFGSVNIIAEGVMLLQRTCQMLTEHSALDYRVHLQLDIIVFSRVL